MGESLRVGVGALTSILGLQLFHGVGGQNRPGGDRRSVESRQATAQVFIIGFLGPLSIDEGT